MRTHSPFKDRWNACINQVICIIVHRCPCISVLHGAGVSCMLGPLNAQPKVRKVAERRERTKLGAVEKPQEIKEVDTEEKQETDRLMEEMFGIIKEHSPVPWLELIMNVESFSQTVENIFTLSFLVRLMKDDVFRSHSW